MRFGGRPFNFRSVLFPSTLIALLLALGFALLFVQRLRRWAIVCIGSGTILYFVLGSGWTANWLLGRLEFYHPAAQIGSTNASATAIVVLTGYAEVDPRLPITGQLNRASAVRILEAARLFAERPLPVHVTGYHQVPELMAVALRSVAGPRLTVEVEANSESTHASAVNLKQRLAANPFFLVTSAGHMPRSVGVFKSLGMHPIPAPTDYLTERNWTNANILPESQYLEMSDLAIHEYAAIAWYRLRGWL